LNTTNLVLQVYILNIEVNIQVILYTFYEHETLMYTSTNGVWWNQWDWPWAQREYCL